MLLLTWMLLACGDGHLRGDVAASPDGKTWFGVIDDNGGACGPMTFDGAPWPHPLGHLEEVEPGPHTLACGGEVAFDVPEGVVFRFDYWGP